MFDAIIEKDRSLTTLAPPKRCHITTMTFIATLSRPVQLYKDAIQKFSAMQGSDPYFTAIGPCAFSDTSVEFHSDAMPSVRTKLFNKGAVQITGCKSHVEAMLTLTELCRVVSAYSGDQTPVEALTMNIALINANVTIDKGIHLTRFAHAARSRGIIAEQPERPPSCILKIPSASTQKYVTVLVYKPGKFVICGAACPEDVSTSYGLVMDLLESVPDILETLPPETTRRGRGHFIWTQLVHCGMPGAMHSHNPTLHHVDTCLYCARFGNVFCNDS